MSQILSEFQENLQKKARFHPLPLDYYLAIIQVQKKRAQQYDVVMETVKNGEQCRKHGHWQKLDDVLFTWYYMSIF